MTPRASRLLLGKEQFPPTNRVPVVQHREIAMLAQRRQDQNWLWLRRGSDRILSENAGMAKVKAAGECKRRQKYRDWWLQSHRPSTGAGPSLFKKTRLTPGGYTE